MASTVNTFMDSKCRIWREFKKAKAASRTKVQLKHKLLCKLMPQDRL